MTASSVVKPSLLFVSALQNAVSAATAARPENEVDVRDLVAVADERLADHHFVDFGHYGVPPIANNTTSTNATPP